MGLPSLCSGTSILPRRHHLHSTVILRVRFHFLWEVNNDKILKKLHVGFLKQGRSLRMLHGGVPVTAVPGCWLVATEDLQDFAQQLQVESFQVQMW